MGPRRLRADAWHGAPPETGPGLIRARAPLTESLAPTAQVPTHGSHDVGALLSHSWFALSYMPPVGPLHACGHEVGVLEEGLSGVVKSGRLTHQYCTSMASMAPAPAPLEGLVGGRLG